MRLALDAKGALPSQDAGRRGFDPIIPIRIEAFRSSRPPSEHESIAARGNKVALHIASTLRVPRALVQSIPRNPYVTAPAPPGGYSLKSSHGVSKCLTSICFRAVAIAIHNA
jgi:hypothetical protein